MRKQYANINDRTERMFNSLVNNEDKSRVNDHTNCSLIETLANGTTAADYAAALNRWRYQGADRQRPMSRQWCEFHYSVAAERKFRFPATVRVRGCDRTIELKLKERKDFHRRQEKYRG
jgi:hypothetical protein